jgi:hypothetical protein
MDRTVHRIVLTIVTITPVMLCLVYVYMGSIKLKLFTVWTHQSYAVYNMDPLNLCCLWNVPIKLKLLTVWTHHTVNNLSLMGPFRKQQV